MNIIVAFLIFFITIVISIPDGYSALSVLDLNNLEQKEIWRGPYGLVSNVVYDKQNDMVYWMADQLYCGKLDNGNFNVRAIMPLEHSYYTFDPLIIVGNQIILSNGTSIISLNTNYPIDNKINVIYGNTKITAMTFSHKLNKIYWSREDGINYNIYRSNIDGSGIELMQSTNVQISSIRINDNTDTMYWSLYYMTNDAIYSSCLNKPNCPNKLICKSLGFSGVTGIEIDTNKNILYFSDFRQQIIYSVDLNEQVIKPTYVANTNLDPIGLSLNMDNHKLYYMGQ